MQAVSGRGGPNQCTDWVGAFVSLMTEEPPLNPLEVKEVLQQLRDHRLQGSPASQILLTTSIGHDSLLKDACQCYQDLKGQRDPSDRVHLLGTMYMQTLAHTPDGRLDRSKSTEYIPILRKILKAKEAEKLLEIPMIKRWLEDYYSASLKMSIPDKLEEDCFRDLL